MKIEIAGPSFQAGVTCPEVPFIDIIKIEISAPNLQGLTYPVLRIKGYTGR
jgi:hypothetical protein